MIPSQLQCVGDHILGIDWSLKSDNAAVCFFIYTHINGSLDLYGFSIMLSFAIVLWLMLGLTWVLIILLYAVFVLTGSFFLLQKLLSVLSCLWCLRGIALLFANQLFKVNPCCPVAVYLPAQAISTSPDFTKAWGSQTAISTTDTWTDTNFIPLLSCGGGGRFSLPPGEAQNLAFPSGLGKIWNRSGVKRECTGCVLHGGEEIDECIC